jgi:hypothetical protein
MASQDNLFSGVYVGLVVDVQDPDELGRVKIMVPGRLGTLYKGWNESNTDIDFYSTTPDKFPEDILTRLKHNLPWARPAMPLWGGGTGSFNFSDGAPFTVPTNAAYTSTDKPVGGQASEGVLARTGNTGRSTGPHLDARWRGFRLKNGTGKYIDASDLDRYLLIGGKPASNWPTTSRHGSVNGRRPTHDGVDLGIPVGTPITLTGGATYADTFWDTKGGGRVVVINTPEGQMSLLHMQEGTQNPNYRSGVSVSVTGVSDNRETHTDGMNPEGNFEQRLAVSSSGGVPQDSKGNVNKTELRNSILNYIKDNPTSIYNNGRIPANGQTYGLNGTSESWANFFANIAGYESGYKSGTINLKDDGGSYGIFQVGPQQVIDYAGIFPEIATSYGIDPNRTYTKEDLLGSADLNTRAMLFLGEATMRDRKYGGFRVGPGFSNGMGATIGENTWKRFANGEPTGDGSNADGRMVQRTTNQGINAYGSVNMSRSGMPVGAFSPPSFGAKVWVMFEGGSPQRPVYMGQVYDPSNIGSWS